MTSVLEVPQGLSYVAAALVSTVILLAGQNITVSKYRKAAGIKYPQAYAELSQVEASVDALKFNCAQRAHQNTLENIPIIVLSTLVSAVKLPHIAAASCGLWVVSRVLYTRGYVTGKPEKRNAGGFGYLPTIVLLGTSLYAAGSLVLAGI
ncbi:hypothetical protein BDP27DRAFT_1380177 [Rhodocollybia butyracea]|uniref:Membrane-associated proteins in eicosanoid and glutathione metabolism n=1 Tax=Rhodocollybia butyracea TaxID=206335 RepID=A0A9P5Q7H1_9AGAR|nr:hypothetical protein BDP27DRAFT_1380177 [Rhodocollybia butyracea]